MHVLCSNGYDQSKEFKPAHHGVTTLLGFIVMYFSRPSFIDRERAFGCMIQLVSSLVVNSGMCGGCPRSTLTYTSLEIKKAVLSCPVLSLLV